MRIFFGHVSLQSLLLLFALVGVSFWWWIDRTRPPELYHLQLWANEFDTDVAKRNPSEFHMPDDDRFFLVVSRSAR